ncbi:hypothetical protein [Nocardioides ferulae]|uniref:hypothetical protein n=1 Tax=Nocardioides ferulae TaxID=2340821 RepID=UPI000EB17577|nr:hypothetical protein [Nocardioides ferulae]
MPQSIRPGDVLAGRYRLVDLLVESRGGRFYRAHDRVLERQVAVHVLAADDPRATQLVEAARRSATVPDRRLLRVLDADRVDGVCFVVNEWGSGTSLDRWLAAEGPLAPREAAWLVGEVADTIATAHLRRVGHGRLAPENVLVDRNGGVRIIGFCVEAALHGIHEDHDSVVETDVADLAGLLYAALTGRWAGRSTSSVPAAPREHDRVLRPRQVRAGVPRPLDTVCDEVLNPVTRGRLPSAPSAQSIADTLLEFVGDPTGLSDGLAARNPSGRSPDLVTLAALPDPPVRERDAAAPPADGSAVEQVAGSGDEGTLAWEPQGDLPADPEPESDSAPDSGPESGDGADSETGPLPPVPPVPADATTAPPAGPSSGDQPTEAGMPVFGDGSDDVSWLRARSTPPPPPPPLEEPPAKPLFAPEPEGGWPSRPPRPAMPTHTGTGAGFWPWDTGTGRGTGTGLRAVVGEPDEVPGRRWLLLASGLAIGLVVLLAVVIAYNLGRGRTPLGAEPQDEASPTPSPSPSATPTPITGLVATDLDPQGEDGGEYADLTALAVDGDPGTAWRTSTYLQNFGPAGLKTGVGLVVDLGAAVPVSEVDLTLVGEGTGVSLYVTEEAPSGVAELEPVAEVVAAAKEQVTLEEPATGRYLTLWLTSLPAVPDGFRGEVAEVVVRG